MADGTDFIPRKPSLSFTNEQPEQFGDAGSHRLSFSEPDFTPGGSTGASGGDDSSGDGFDASIHVSRDNRNADGSYRRKRGRKSGTTASPRSRKGTLSASVDGLAMTMAMVSAAIAGASKSPELNIDTAESHALAAATANFLDQFDIRPNPKVEAAVGLVIAFSAVYVPKIGAANMRKKTERLAIEAEANKLSEEQIFAGA